MERVDVLVVGGGQAGLATSHELGRLGVEHLVLERGRIGQSWRDRWDSFCLVTPNWSVRLPGGTYAGDDPDGFLPRVEVVAYLEGFAKDAGAPIREGVEVTSLRQSIDGFKAETSQGEVSARRVVLATGAYQRPHRPAGASTVPPELFVIDVERYRRPDALPAGRVLVVGSGQSGCQIAEELQAAGRDVVLACGRAPWAPRRIGDHDIFWWAAESGFLAQRRTDLPDPSARLAANILATGHDGGHDLHLRVLRDRGITLAGHFLGVSAGRIRFAADLAETVAWGDERFRQFMDLVRRTADARELPEVSIPEPPPWRSPELEVIPIDGLGALIFSGGFRPDYRAWLPWPEAFDDLGFPIQSDGASSVVDGLWFVGVHFLRTRASSLLLGVGADATVVGEAIARGSTGAPLAPGRDR